MHLFVCKNIFEVFCDQRFINLGKTGQKKANQKLE